MLVQIARRGNIGGARPSSTSVNVPRGTFGVVGQVQQYRSVVEVRISMIITINDNIKIWQEFNPFEGPYDKNAPDSFRSTRTLANWGFNKEHISIRQ